MSEDKKALIRALNDSFRRTLLGGRVVLTQGVMALPDDIYANLMQAIRTFDRFGEGNDPHQEHDFVSVEVGGHKVFAKIDYFDTKLENHSPDPANPQVTQRVMTVMLASEY